MTSPKSKPSDPETRRETLYSSFPWDDSAVDEARAASMSDEGGVSAAFLDKCDPYAEPEPPDAPRRRWRRTVLWGAFAGALAAVVVGAVALARHRHESVFA